MNEYLVEIIVALIGLLAMASIYVVYRFSFKKSKVSNKVKQFGIGRVHNNAVVSQNTSQQDEDNDK